MFQPINPVGPILLRQPSSPSSRGDASREGFEEKSSRIKKRR
nr:unnamed protein product [Digitaria exilis]